MSYQLLEIELTSPVSTLQIPDDVRGLGITVRYRDRPVDFRLQSLGSENIIDIDELQSSLRERTQYSILETNIAAELNFEQPRTTSTHQDEHSLTIAICTHDRTELLERCLESIQVHAAKSASVIEIIVVDNNPSDASTKHLVSKYENVIYHCEPLAGLDFARNRALSVATGDIIAYLDDDVVIDRGWLRGLLSSINDHPDAGAYTGQVLPLELNTEAQILFEERGGFRRGFRRVHYKPARPDDIYYPCNTGIFGVGANMAFRRSVLLDIHGFDNALDTGAPLPGGGDHDIFYRVVQHGRDIVYEPSYMVYHRHRTEMTALRKQYRSWGTGTMAFIAKTYRNDQAQRPRIRRLVAWWFKNQFRQLAKSLLGRHSLPASMVVSETIGGIVGLCGEYGRSAKRVERIKLGA